MSDTYCKLSSDIVYSSLWQQPGDICKVWISLLALKDQRGIVTQNIVGLSRLICLPVETIEHAIKIFESPDPATKTQEHEGRRLIRVPDGLLILNHQKYQEVGWSDEKKEFERRRKAEQRRRRDERLGIRRKTRKYPGLKAQTP